MRALILCNFGLLAFLLSNPFLAVKGKYCDVGWQLHNNHCYAYYDQKLTWNDAETWCQEHYHGHLVSIVSQEKVTSLSNYMTDFNNEHGNVWIGLVATHDELPSSYRWTDGSPYTFAFWEPGAPHFSIPSADCVSLTHNSGYSEWTNDYCTTYKSFICQYKL